jgi:hypothetical protein
MYELHLISLHLQARPPIGWEKASVHSKLRSITPVATKMHVILRGVVVLTWMHDTSELV